MKVLTENIQASAPTGGFRRVGMWSVIACLILGHARPAPAQIADDALPLPLPGAPGATAPQAPPHIPLSLPATLSSEPSLLESGPARPVPATPIGSSAPASARSSTSASGQFVVLGPELRVRNALATRADQIAQDLNRLLRTQERWVLPIVVLIKEIKPGEAASQRITTQVGELSHGGFHLQLTVPERTGLKPIEFKRELVRLLLAERILRQHKQLGTERGQLLPDWVHTGVVEAMEFRNRTRPSAVFAAIFKSGKVHGIQEILDVEPTKLDGLSRTIYETSCCALVLALLDQPEGPLRFSRFLNALAVDSKAERELLTQWFPSLAQSDTSLNKWWSLQLASLASPSMAETLDPADTADLLDAALTFRLRTESGTLPVPQLVASIASQRPKIDAGGAPPDSAAARAKAAGPAKASANRQIASKAKASPSQNTESETAADESTEDKRPGFLRRMLGMDAKNEKEDAEDASAQEEKKKETASPPEVAKVEKDPPQTEEESPSKTARSRSKAAKPEAKASPAAAADTPESKERSGGLLKWFRGKKTDEAKPETESGDKGKGAHLRSPALLGIEQLLAGLSPSLPPPTADLARRSWPPNGRFVMQENAPPAAATTTEPPPPLPEPPRIPEASPIPEQPTAPTQEPASEEFIPPPAQPPPLPPNLERLPDPGIEPEAPANGSAWVDFPIEDFEIILKHPDKDQLLRLATNRLNEVVVRGNVLFREVALAYAAILEDLRAGKTRGLDSRLKDLRQQAVKAYASACAVRDHLDWYEASQSNEDSGLFDNFLNLPAELREELPPRADPISVYLDALDAEFSK